LKIVDLTSFAPTFSFPLPITRMAQNPVHGMSKACAPNHLVEGLLSW